MRIQQNSIFYDKANQINYRILDSDPKSVCLLTMQDNYSAYPKPIIMSRNEFEKEFKRGGYEEVPLANTKKSYTSISEKAKEKADREFEQCQTLEREFGSDLFDKDKRRKLIEPYCEEWGISINTCQRMLNRFWMGGRTWSSMLGGNARNGGRGKAKEGYRKEGVYSLGPEDHKNIFKYYSKSLTEEGRSKDSCYHQMIHDKYSNKDGIVNEAHPTYNQFLYNGKTNFTLEQEMLGKAGESAFNSRFEVATGDNQNGTLGKYGYCSMMDSTMLDIYVTDNDVPEDVINRIHLTAIMDAETGYLQGIYRSFHNPSYSDQIECIYCMASDKKKYFKEHFDIDIKEDDWPGAGIPMKIIADNGPMNTEQIENLCLEYGITIKYSEAYGPKKKGRLERFWKTLNKRLSTIDGGVRRDSGRSGRKDPRLDAGITLHQLDELIVQTVILYNKALGKTKYQKREFNMHGVKNAPQSRMVFLEESGMSRLRTVDPDEFRMRCLPRKSVKVTKQGVKILGLTYSAEPDDANLKSILNNLYMSKATVEVAVSKKINEIYLITRDKKTNEEIIHTLKMCGGKERNRTLEWEDIEEANQKAKEIQKLKEKEDTQMKADYEGMMEDLRKQARKNKSKPKTKSAAKRKKDIPENTRKASQKEGLFEGLDPTVETDRDPFFDYGGLNMNDDVSYLDDYDFFKDDEDE